MNINAHYLHRIDMIRRSTPSIARLFHKALLKELRYDSTLKFSEKEVIREHAGLALLYSDKKHGTVGDCEEAKPPRILSVWQRFKVWLG